MIRSARTALALYGYSLQGTEIVSPTGRNTGAFVSERRGRLYVRAENGSLLYSGGDAGQFVERYWFAKQLPKEK